MNQQDIKVYQPYQPFPAIPLSSTKHAHTSQQSHTSLFLQIHPLSNHNSSIIITVKSRNTELLTPTASLYNTIITRETIIASLAARRKRADGVRNAESFAFHRGRAGTAGVGAAAFDWVVALRSGEGGVRAGAVGADAAYALGGVSRESICGKGVSYLCTASTAVVGVRQHVFGAGRSICAESVDQVPSDDRVWL